MKRPTTLIPFLATLLIACLPVKGTVASAQSLRLTPPAATVFAGERLEIAAPEEVAWEASGGTVDPARGRATVYTAPAEPGRYTVTALDPADPARRAVAVVTVLPKPQGYLGYALAGGRSFSAAVARDGTVWWWGQVKDAQSAVPVQLDGVRGARSLAAADSGLAVVTEDGALVWVSGDLKTRRRVDSGVVFADATGYDTVVYVKPDGGLWLFDPSKDARLQRLRVGDRELQQPVAVWTFYRNGPFATLVAIDARGRAWRLDSRSSPDSLRPEPLAVASPRVVQVARLRTPPDTYNDRTYAVLLGEDGRLWYSDPLASLEVRPLEGPGPAVRFVAGSGAVLLAVDEAGEVWRLGGIGGRWARVPGLKDVRQVARGAEHSLAVRSDGSVFAWGKNTSAQLGDGTADDSDTPVEVLGLKARLP
ncbi:Regulator of chromosome condensation (RCC1) repeat protein [Calidithermus terrae]|uniref:Regulator of chromosome condensation (RCC1) repeat protein n=1 Tax=Calidithermus terrae TaxID=1408545 RepID=A0A399DV17_9DEIN|nr:hypothetical protein [Calidithermus terrae]RIH75008.1 Regulator of chromosome condensation (RCC1) repeat protein [Calidithermus terrae]